ncbi:MAG: pyruvate:ferredoxin (flavodoxin) oxidoreductase [Sulfuricurvum sp.]
MSLPSSTYAIIDANEAVARIAHRLNEVIAIYPITPASVMGELCDLYSSEGKTNLFGTVPEVVEMQSEGGAAGAVHGALQSGALTTTFTASQGLLLMIPDMYKIAGELIPCVIHVAARSLAAQALSIFGDHSDVMAARQSGFAMLCSANGQEAHDFAFIAQNATLKSRIPFLHFFDGFRTSHEVDKIILIPDELLDRLIDRDAIEAHRRRALSPDHPFIRGTSQNPDVYFQGRESVNRFYDALPEILQNLFNEFAPFSGRQYQLFDYVGASDAQRIVILMGSGAEAVHEYVEAACAHGEKIGLIKVRLYRPFSQQHLLGALPSTVRSIAVLDRTKEPGSVAEPLYLDVVAALAEHSIQTSAPLPKIVGGRYGLSSKEFTPGMIRAVYENLSSANPKNHFTVGIEDDVTHTSLEWERDFALIHPGRFEAMFFGLGSDGTVGANKNSIKIIGERTKRFVQGYFVYDSKKSGSMTTSHLRIDDAPIRSTYLISQADFVACHQSVFMEKFDILSSLKEGGIFLLNTPISKDDIYRHLPRSVQIELQDKKIRFYAIDAYTLAQECSLGSRINTIMQYAFFLLSGIIDKTDVLEAIQESIRHTYGKKGDEVIQNNFAALERTQSALFEVPMSDAINSDHERQPMIRGSDNPFLLRVTSRLIAGEGDLLPVSAMSPDGTWPSGTTRYEKRNLATHIPVWESDLCIQCNKCVLVCPHAVIRSIVADQTLLTNLPEGFSTLPAKGKMFRDDEYFTLQISAEDCTGCAMCVESCPVEDKQDREHKAINMTPIESVIGQAKQNWEFFIALPAIDRSRIDHAKIKESQFLEPLFEFSGACAGCGETPYLKLATQLFGDRMIVANATGCSSIYGGNLPTTPWTKNAQGRGVAWANSLFEDNAEFGLGMRLAIDHHESEAKHLLETLKDRLGTIAVDELLHADQNTEEGIEEQRKKIETLKEALKLIEDPVARELETLCDYLAKKSVWIIGGDGWAYDIGYGGLDHLFSSGKNVNILVLDTQVYSNTGGQQSKATPTGAVAKFAAGGKDHPAKDLAMMALSYGDVYVARVAMGASDTQTLKAFIEAEAYEGVSIIIAYSHCIAHGYDLRYGMEHQKSAVESGLWPLFRYNPLQKAEGKNPFSLDYKEPHREVSEYMMSENRFASLIRHDHERGSYLVNAAAEHARQTYQHYLYLSNEYALNKPQPS